MNPIRVIQYGLGPIGCAAARAVLEKPGLELVGAVDIAPDKIGQDLARILGLSGRLGIRVTDDAPKLFRGVNAQAIVHTTRSFFRDVYSQLEQAARAGLNVVSSTEELLYPQLRNARMAANLDRLARKCGATILGTGVNPGFIMDTLPLFMSGVCKSVRRIRITRRVDASTRRLPLQQKIGAGMKAEEFRRLVREGKLGHVGLLESMGLLALGLGWKLDKTGEKIEPVLARSRLETRYLTIAPGEVCGLRHTGGGHARGRKLIEMDLQMYVGAEDPMDTIEIHGEPNLHMVLRGGVAGDVATVASLINAIPRVLEAEPGLKTMLDLPLPRAFQPSHGVP